MDAFGKAPRNSSGRPAQRAQPYGDRATAMDIEDPSGLQELETPKNSLKVSGQTDVNRLASQICSLCRQNDPPALLTIGNTSINQAVKGIAVARQELIKENIELSFQPAFRHVNRTKPLIAFYLSINDLAASQQMGEESELSVASHSKITPVAGAIAGRVREHKLVIMTAIGVDAVTNGVLAAGNARLFLEKDGMDIKIQPEFTKLDKNGSQLSAMRFFIVSEPI